VRLVKAWKLKLAEMHQVTIMAANAMALQWPPSDEDFLELPTPQYSQVADVYFKEVSANQGGLCPRQLFALKSHVWEQLC